MSDAAAVVSSGPTPNPGCTAVVLYTTSIATSSNIRSATATLRLILESKGLKYSEVDLALDSTQRQVMLQGSDGIKTLPQVHVNGRYIGDCPAVQALEDCGELSALLGL